MTAHRLLHGADFHSGSSWQREARHRARIIATCCETIVTPSEIAATIKADGNIDPYRAIDLIEKLIARAYDTAVARTIGVENV